MNLKMNCSLPFYRFKSDLSDFLRVYLVSHAAQALSIKFSVLLTALLKILKHFKERGIL